MSLRFGPAVRIRARNEFQSVQQRGRRVSTRCLILLAQPNQLGRDRLGVIASRRFGDAVVRTRAKRRLREVFRHQQPDCVGATGRISLDVVAIPKHELLQTSFAIVQQEFASGMEKLRRLKFETHVHG